MSCKQTSTEELPRIIPVKPPIVNKNKNPVNQRTSGLNLLDFIPPNVASHLKILIPVGTAIIMVAEVKYARVSTSIPTVNIWWPQTINPKIPIVNIA